MMMNTTFLAKLNADTLKEIVAAQVDDLIERRAISDPELYKKCFYEAFPEEEALCANVEGFGVIAGEAFKEYHKPRAAAKADAEDMDGSDEEAEEVDEEAEEAEEVDEEE